MSESKKSAEQVEQERLTRRQVLRKLGFGAGLSAIMLLGADDLARMVGERMRQMEGDNKVADRIAQEFQSAGIAFADSGDGASGGTLDGKCDYPCGECAGTFVGTCHQNNNYGMSGIECCQTECEKCCEKQVVVGPVFVVRIM